MKYTSKSTVLLLTLSCSAVSAPLYFNSTEVSEDGVWDWKNKGYIIGGGDGNYGDLTLKGSSSFDFRFKVGFDGGNGTLTISDSTKSLNQSTNFEVGTVSPYDTFVNDTTGTLNLIGRDIGGMNSLNLSVGSSGPYDWNTTRDSQVTGTLNITDGAILNVGAENEGITDNNAYVGFGNSSNTGIINISGPGSHMNILDDDLAKYYGYAASGNLYLGFIGKGIVNITDGGTLTSGAISASSSPENDDGISVLKPPSAEINVSGAGSKLIVQSQMSLAADALDSVVMIDVLLYQKGAGSAVLNIDNYADVIFEGKASIDGIGFDVRTSGLFMASRPGTSAIVNLNKNGYLSIANSNLSPEADAIIAGDGYYAFNLNGGTLRFNDCTYCDNRLSTKVNMNVLSESFLEARNAKEMYLNGSLSGKGGIVKTGEGLVALSGVNRYLGGTRVENGELRSDGDGAFVNNTSYIVNGGKLNLNNHDLTMSLLSGRGGVVDVTDARLLIDQKENSLYAGSFAGTGQTEKRGTSTLYLSGDSKNYNGDFSVTGGGLDSSVALGGHITSHNGGILSAEGYLGSTDIKKGGILRVGSYYSEKFTPSQLVIDNKLINDGSIILGRSGNISKGQVGNELLVSGDYAGNQGHIYFNTVLGDDSSPTDHMKVSGDTSGTTYVHVNNVGGLGDYTTRGIELISVGGQSTGLFLQKDRIVGGAYEYFLSRGKETDYSNWYLVNTKPAPQPEPDPQPEPTPQPEPDPQPEPTPQPEPDPQPEPTPQPEPDPQPEPTPQPEPAPQPEPNPEPVIRPEGSEYATNLLAANTLFVHRLHDRLGETHYVDALTGEEKVTSMWLRNIGGHTRYKDSSGQLKTQANRYVIQLGGDIAQWSSNAENRFHLGIMGGYANQKSNTRSGYSGYRADGSVNGYSAGVYGTWLQDNHEKTGGYVDTWMLYNWFNNSVSGEKLASEKYKSKGIIASIEAGYTWKTGEKNARESYYVQPVAQLTWMGVKADDHREYNGTMVHGEGDGNVQSRLGVRAFIKGHSLIDEGKNREFEPFVEANWLHNTKTFGTQMDGVKIKLAGTRNIGELKLGVEGQINPNVNLWGNVAQQIGDKGYSDTQAMLGVKYIY